MKYWLSIICILNSVYSYSNNDTHIEINYLGNQDKIKRDIHIYKYGAKYAPIPPDGTAYYFGVEYYEVDQTGYILLESFISEYNSKNNESTIDTTNLHCTPCYSIDIKESNNTPVLKFYLKDTKQIDRFFMNFVSVMHDGKINDELERKIEELIHHRE